jgi:hypothetical protein
MVSGLMKLAVTGSCADEASVMRRFFLLMGGADSEAVYDGRSGPTVLDGQLTDLGSMRPQRPGPVEVGSRAYQAARSGAQESGGMLSAYVLIETEVGKVAHVAQAHQARWGATGGGPGRGWSEAAAGP